ncbi:MAG: DUF3047 domain-containing protein [Thiohalocapsa sp. PB-PSB1]|jgi:head-tail adaptor|nr:MAG: hypothetical protein N838_21310 [Thiohalocapsa sp. PB-PSB1]QQO56702.1 MAG: DUF3047 domain-containing protein [Thiohalocapsa sp. PB-PSB1]HCS91886.1 DUF3047 domain-containing protein [Chromatiaceae bacterium]
MNDDDNDKQQKRSRDIRTAALVRQWVDEQRDVTADLRAAFSENSAPVTGIAISADPDQTGGSVRSWSAGIAFHPSRQDSGQLQAT